MTDSTPIQLEIQFPTVNLCECGCGQPAPIAKKTCKSDGRIQGQPMRFVRGHQSRRPISDRFWEKVDRSGGPNSCWLWTGSKNRLYGRISVGNRGIYVHRYSWEIHNGKIPPNLDCLHKCDNPPCVNPAHLFLGTHQENMDDMVKKHRSNTARGSRNGTSKLCESDIPTIRQLYSRDGLTQEKISKMYHVSTVSISNIVRRKKWKHIP